jgi:hypothetical protein
MAQVQADIGQIESTAPGAAERPFRCFELPAYQSPDGPRGIELFTGIKVGGHGFESAVLMPAVRDFVFRDEKSSHRNDELESASAAAQDATEQRFDDGRGDNLDIKERG